MKIHGEPGLGMLLDYKAEGDLSTLIPNEGFPEWAMQGIMVQIRDVLLYLHRREILHRDIKPSNVFRVVHCLTWEWIGRKVSGPLT